MVVLSNSFIFLKNQESSQILRTFSVRTFKLTTKKKTTAVSMSFLGLKIPILVGGKFSIFDLNPTIMHIAEEIFGIFILAPWRDCVIVNISVQFCNNGFKKGIILEYDPITGLF